MPDLPFQTGEDLERLLCRVFLAAGDQSPVQRRLAVTFLIHAPEACVRVDGRDGQTAHLSRSDEARGTPSDLVFELDSGEAAHAFWRGGLSPVEAVRSGRLRLRGPLLQALGLAPGLGKVQAAYREATGAPAQ
ncbi:hypothetical protein [Deinococcus gobiensis]|uniref:SCP2 domain-containing protein n=1 Tax=Deinococcus gobiensis (strain DSM 21396 / JCM 16679 / CGMCC 1.7299 / I-0) TaxID=745776 RepID=H8GZH7_DEIGI|nr:hypothetical protein [Deinococcus gobiensis]AFD26215.1 hypothetical protein DGo_CA2288 [Deinococcus gobiensis I-0]